jgi:hypothetical protein
MPSYLAESYAAGSAAELQAAIARLERAAEEIAATGRRLRYVRSTFVSEDELCFHVFEADAPDDVDEVGRRAGLLFDHVVEATPVSSGGSTSTSQEEES